MNFKYEIDKEKAVLIFGQAIDLYNEWEAYLKTLNAKYVLFNFKATAKTVKELGTKTIAFIALIKEMKRISDEDVVINLSEPQGYKNGRKHNKGN